MKGGPVSRRRATSREGWASVPRVPGSVVGTSHLSGGASHGDRAARRLNQKAAVEDEAMTCGERALADASKLIGVTG